MYKQIVLTVSIFFSVLLASAQEVRQMSLEEAISYALEHNPTVINAKLDEKIADGRISENIATGLPQINGGIDIANNFELPTSFLPGSFVGSPEPEVPIQFGTQYSGSATLSLRQMIFDGSFFVGLEAAKTYKELSTKQLVKTKIDIAEAVAKAYYAVLVSELSLDLINKNYGRLDSLLWETTEMNINGFVEKMDVSRVKVQFNNIKVEKLNAEKLLDVTRANLSFQLGLPVSEVLELTDVLDNIVFNDEQEVEFSYSNRVEYGLLQTNQQLAVLDKKWNNVRYLPSIDLYATVGANLGTGDAANILDISNEWYNFGLVGVRVKIPVFDGLQKHFINQQKKIKLEQIDQSFSQLERGIDFEIANAKTKLENALGVLKSQEENMALSEDVYSISKIKYKEGLGSNFEVISADADFKAAQTNYFMALYTALIAKVEYQKTIGKLL